MFHTIMHCVKTIFGSPSKYQLRILTFSCFVLSITCSVVMAMPLFFQQPNLLCRNPYPNSIIYSCPQSEACSSGIVSWIDYTTSPMSLVTEYQLICDKSIYINYIGSLTYFFTCIGNIYYTFFSKDGQKLKLCHNICVICGILLCLIYFLNSPFLIVILISIYDFLFIAFNLVPFIIIANISADNQIFRSWGISLLNSAWGFSQIYTGILGYIYFNWKVLIVFYIGLPLLILAYIYRDLRSLEGLNNLEPSSGSIDRESIFKIFSYPSLRSFIFYAMVAVIVRFIGYYGTNYIMGALLGNIYMNQICLGLTEIVGCALGGYFTAYFPRKKILKLCYFINGCSYLIFAFIGKDKMQSDSTILAIIVNVGLILIGKLAICVSISCASVCFTEILPSYVRHVGFGIIYCAGRLFVVFLPQFIWLMQKLGMNPFFGFALLSAIGYFCVNGFIETFGCQIKEYPVEEIEMKDKANPLLIG